MTDNKPRMIGLMLVSALVGFGAGMTLDRFVDGDSTESASEHNFMFQDKKVDPNMPYAIFKGKPGTGELWYARKSEKGVLIWQKVTHPELLD